MDRKNIYLTVGGIVATLLFSWLLYRLQQSSAVSTLATSTASENVPLVDTNSYPTIASEGSSGSSGGSAVISNPVLDTSSEGSSDSSSSNGTDANAGVSSWLESLSAEFASKITGAGNDLLPTYTPSVFTTPNIPVYATDASGATGSGVVASTPASSTSVDAVSNTGVQIVDTAINQAVHDDHITSTVGAI